jgi:hypothetical protein
MPNRVEVDVVEPPFEVVLVLDGVFPKSGLPHASPVLTTLSSSDFSFLPTSGKPAFSELKLDPAPT